MILDELADWWPVPIYYPGYIPLDYDDVIKEGDVWVDGDRDVEKAVRTVGMFAVQAARDQVASHVQDWGHTIGRAKHLQGWVYRPAGYVVIPVLQKQSFYATPLPLP